VRFQAEESQLKTMLPDCWGTAHPEFVLGTASKNPAPSPLPNAISDAEPSPKDVPANTSCGKARAYYDRVANA